MGRACSMHGKISSAYKLWLESLKGRDHFENLAISRKIILK
jgi:hypothetical protein